MVRSTSPSVLVSRCGCAGGEAARIVLWVRGDHDMATEVSITVGIARAAQRDDMPVLVDLSGVTFMDASTVRAIVGSRDRLQSHGQSLELRAPSPQARRVLELCGLTDLIWSEPIVATAAAAALATWVDVPASAPAALVDGDARRASRPAATRLPLGVLAAIEVEADEADATADVDRGGP